MSHLGVPRLAQFDRKKGASRQGGAVFGMAECSGCLRVYPVLNCLFPLWVRSLPYWFILFFFFPSLLLRVREGLDYTCLIAL